jgi:GGDEF domain-containing protein
MTIENFIDKANYLELNEIKNWNLEKIIKYMKENHIERLYITDNLRPIFLINSQIIVDIFLSNKLNTLIEDFINDTTNIVPLNHDRHIIETYNYMRKERIEYAPVVKNSKLIGEISFVTLSIKISYIAIKDKLTNVYNEKYFSILIEEYNEIDQAVGIIMVKLENLSIYEGIYGLDFVNKALVEFAKVIENSIRDVDFLFRNDNVFKILTFNNAEITMKIKKRIENKLNQTLIDDIKVPFIIVATHIPEIDSNIILAVEELERKLIKRD